MKQILFLDNGVEKDIDDKKKSLISILDEGIDNYILTDDNYKKKIL